MNISSELLNEILSHAALNERNTKTVAAILSSAGHILKNCKRWVYHRDACLRQIKNKIEVE